MRLRTSVLAAALTACTVAAPFASGPARAEMGVSIEVPRQDVLPWTFVGPLGRFDQAQLRRGFQVFNEACSACHSLHHVAYRDLTALGIGFGPEDIKGLAAQYQVQDGPDENGKLFMRPARPADAFAPPFPNKEAARAANKGMYPPDLSLIVRARNGGPDFLYAFLTGFVPPPEGFEVPPGMTYNAAVSGHLTGMKGVLTDGYVDYDDGTKATVSQMARDLTTFLAWTADPHMAERKELGMKVVIFLILLTLVFIALKLEVWAPLHRPSKPALTKPQPRNA